MDSLRFAPSALPILEEALQTIEKIFHFKASGKYIVIALIPLVGKPNIWSLASLPLLRLLLVLPTSPCQGLDSFLMT